MIPTTRAEAAAARAANVRTKADRPSQRRGYEDSPVNGFTRGLSANTQLRKASGDGDFLHFTGQATVYERWYGMWDMFGPYDEIVSAGAGANSLARSDLSVPLVLDHEPLRRIAITDNGSLSLVENDEALNIDAPKLNPRDHDVAYIQPKFEDDLRLEMSFRFRIIRGYWSDDFTQYRIEEYDIHRGDVAIVGYGANPHTSGELRGVSDEKAAERIRGIDRVREFETTLRST